ncbi:MAG: molybdopterin molybdotransferase MoeA [Gammaproteobacteria bacterium]|nr:molybdopterin molybdotransferase MoeA [Gammaproteobacteria bacterium]MYD01828.1 molybdopterin molybdotransferase MoeA [Gammaproteobacteria bacterium]MYI26037.1 molybdopterin molybdotransferase MoeA [Gammaproteobacteria bacterium]
MKLIPYREACATLAAACTPGPEESVPARRALGAVASRPAIGAFASPAFNNAAMDGFAICAADTAGAAEGSPVELPIAGELKVGAYAEAAMPGSACALRVATGALTPPPLDTVVPLEQAAVIKRPGATVLRFLKPVEEGRNLRMEGEEYSAGAAFDFTGERLHAGHIALLSAAGIDELYLRRPPPLGLLTTGDEVRPPGAALAPGEIANVNAAWMAAWCAERRVPVAHAQHVRDDPGDLARGFQDARESGARILVSSGSASAGRHDVLRQALKELGARIVFHGVAMRPGKPALFALLHDGTPVFGLPGNPLATAAGMRFLVWPGIRAILAMKPEKPQRKPLAHSCDLREGHTHFLLAHHDNEIGALKLVRPQRPGQAGALAAAHCWLRLDGGRHGAGALAGSYPL